MNRRDFVKMTGVGAAGMLAGGLLPLALPGRVRGQAAAPADLDLSLTAGGDRLAILPGPPTEVWKYKAQVRQGDPAGVTEIPGSYLGPVIRVNQGQKIRVELINELPRETIIHWHGLHLSAENDGHPRYVIPPGGKYQYQFEVLNRAGTYWFHPHPHKLTGPQVYGGLAGLFIVSDQEEQALGLPSGEYDLPLVIQDRTFGPDNQLIYLARGMVDLEAGFLGDMILVNGRPYYTQPVAPTAYRLRLLNGSNSRIYKLAWSDGSPLVVIGTDGGLLDQPLRLPSVMFGPAERVELWADFSRYAPGAEPALVSLPFETGEQAHNITGGGMTGGGVTLPNGAPFPIMKMKVGGPLPDEVPVLPEKLSVIETYRLEDAVNKSKPKPFVLAMGHMAATINNRVFQMEEVAEDEMVRLGDMEVWEFINTIGRTGMGMTVIDMPHPMHLHGLQFQVLDRHGGPDEIYMDRGWKDTVLVMPGQRLRLLVKFTDFTGMYLYHCHNLEHEDLGMMRNYLVQPA